MKAILFILGLLFVASYAQVTYNPGATVMVKDWLIFQIKDIIVPSIMEEFKQIKLKDTGVNATHYELMIYDMETDIIPLTHDDIEVITDEPQNTLTITIKDFHVQFLGNSMARFYFLHAHGECVLDATIKTISFTVAPKLRDDGHGGNAIDYDIKSVKLDPGEIKFVKLHLGILPEKILEEMANTIIKACEFVFKAFETILDKVIVDVLDHFRAKIPTSVAIPNSLFSVSVSFPNIPHMMADRIEVPIDGTLFVTSEGYNPHQVDKTFVPAFDPEDTNNLQLHLHEYVIDTAIGALQKTGTSYTVTKDTLAPLNLPVNILTTTYVSHLFPKTVCAYGKDKEMTIQISIKEHDDSSFHFAAGKIYGELIPNFSFFVGKDKAFSFDIKLNLDININFQIEGLTTKVTGKVNTVSLTDAGFTPGGVDKCDLPDIISKFEPMAEVAAEDAINQILAAGIEIPVVQLFKGLFNVELEKVYMEIKDKFMEVSFTIDVEK